MYTDDFERAEWEQTTSRFARCTVTGAGKLAAAIAVANVRLGYCFLNYGTSVT